VIRDRTDRRTTDMGRFSVRDRIAQLDPDRDFFEINQLMSNREFPWDMNQALTFALFRTYAVPSIGALLFRTGEFTERTQKRHDDTVLILDAILEHGPDSSEGRAAFRRMNRMHGSYPIGQDDLRYVLSTFVVTPIRWIDAYGWRRLTEIERIAAANYWRMMGHHMAIRDMPQTWQGFAHYLDDYERAHFAFEPGGRAVADATLELFATFPLNRLLPAPVVRRVAWSVMDGPLLDAFGYPHPHPLVRALVRLGLRARGRVVRFLPPRRRPFFFRRLPQVRSYPDGYRIEQLGTFPARTGPAG
jgi:ER-bound oxygenase mpaB/B'/Rubber oxygenase, catalytic domain